MNDFSGNIEAVFLKLGTTKCPSQKEQNDTRSAVVMTTVLPLVLSY